MASHADRQPAAQIKLPSLRLVWRASAASTAKWRLGLFAFELKGTSRQLIVHVSLRGALQWGVISLIAGYFFGTAALAWWWGKNPYNQITYADLVLPTHWSQLSEKRGQARIDEGIHDLRTGNYATGIMLLNGGLARKPSDMRGRLTLAQINMSLGYLYRALQILEDGLDYATPPQAYADTMFHLSAYLEDYERVLAIAGRIDSTLPSGGNRMRRRLLAQRAVALEKLQRFDELEKLRNESQEAPSFAVEAAWARAQAARGQPQEALREIARNPDRFGVTADRCQIQLTLAVAAADRATADAAIHDWLADEPLRAPPRIEEIIALISFGDEARARDRIQRFFINFGSDRPAVGLLVKKLSNFPDPIWLKRVRSEAEAYGSWRLEMRLLYVQGLIQAGNISEALAEFNLTNDLITKNHTPDGGWAEGTQRLLDVIISDSPSNRSQFIAYFRERRVTPDAFRFALKGLQKSGSFEVAAELAVLARNRFPALREAAPDALTFAVARKPVATPSAPSSELQARAELRILDAELADRKYASAFESLKRIEAGNLAGLAPELLLRRIELHGFLDELTQLSAAVQLYLSQPEVNQSRLRDIVLKWQTAGRTESTAVLAREVTTRFANAKWAIALLPTSSRTEGTPTFTISVAIRNEADARQALRLIDTDIAAGRFQEALSRLKDIDRAKVESVQSDVMLRRINAYGSLREQSELTAVLGYYLTGNNPDFTALREFATQWNTATHRDSALTLLRETLARFPQARWAIDLRKKIEGDLVVAPEKN